MTRDRTPPTTTTSLTVRSALDVDDAQAAQRRLRIQQQRGGLFPQTMTDLQAAQLARLSLAYGLDPFTGEMILFQGAPYVTIKGYVRAAVDHPQYDGMEEPRGPTAAEREAFHVGPEEYFFVVKVWRKDRRFPATGYGRARPGERMRDGRGGWTTHPVVEQYPAEMALKRAKMRALREAFVLSLPVFDEERGHPIDTDAPLLEGTARPAQDDPYGIDARLDQSEAERAEREAHGEFLDPVFFKDEPAAAGGITAEQVKAIHAIASAIGWITRDDEAVYREALRVTFGVTSSKELTESQAAAFLEMLVAEQQRLIAEAEPVTGPATQRQLDHYAQALTRANQLGIDLAPYAIATDQIDAATLDALQANLDAAISASEPPDRLEGM